MISTTRRFMRLEAAVVIVLAIILSACQPSKTATPAADIPTANPGQASGASTLAANPAGTAAPLVSPTPAATPTLFVLPGAITTSTGLQYLEENAGTGAAPKPGDLITMHYIASLTDGTELSNTYTNNQPATTVWGANRLLPGWEEGVGLMKSGGKAKLVLPATLAFGAEGSGNIPPNTQIVIEVELLTIEPAPIPTKVDETKLTTNESGLQYFDIRLGDGMAAAEKYTVTTAFIIWVKTATGYTFVGRSTDDSKLSFVLGHSDVVFPGWEEGTTGMKVGGKRLVIVPPELGMGAQGNSVIPANSTLVMEIELLDVKEPRLPVQVDEADYTTTNSGLKYHDFTVGSGESPKSGQTVVVHYTGWLTDGTQFDSSVDRGEPFSFVLGVGNVIPGWDEGVATMKVGGKRQLVIPSALGYGDEGSGGVIPGGATLIFEVELLEIQ